MKGKDFVQREAALAANAAFIPQGDPASPYFLGQINQDRTKITDTVSGRQYNLSFTGNPREFEYATAISDTDAIVNAQNGVFISTDGSNSRQWLLYGYNLIIPIASFTNSEGIITTQFNVDPDSVISSLRATNVTTDSSGTPISELPFGALPTLCIYDFKTDKNYYLPQDEPFMQITSDMLPTVSDEITISEGGITTIQDFGNGIEVVTTRTDPTISSLRFVQTNSGSTKFWAFFSKDARKLVVVKVGAKFTALNSATTPISTAERDDLAKTLTGYSLGFTRQTFDANEFFYMSDSVYTVHWCIFSGLSLGVSESAGLGVVNYSSKTSGDYDIETKKFPESVQLNWGVNDISGPAISQFTDVGGGPPVANLTKTTTGSTLFSVKDIGIEPFINTDDGGNIIISIAGVFISTLITLVVENLASVDTGFAGDGSIGSQITLTELSNSIDGTSARTVGIFQIPAINTSTPGDLITYRSFNAADTPVIHLGDDLNPIGGTNTFAPCTGLENSLFINAPLMYENLGPGISLTKPSGDDFFTFYLNWGVTSALGFYVKGNDLYYQDLTLTLDGSNSINILKNGIPHSSLSISDAVMFVNDTDNIYLITDKSDPYFDYLLAQLALDVFEGANGVEDVDHYKGLSESVYSSGLHFQVFSNLARRLDLNQNGSRFSRNSVFTILDGATDGIPITTVFAPDGPSQDQPIPSVSRGPSKDYDTTRGDPFNDVLLNLRILTLSFDETKKPTLTVKFLKAKSARYGGARWIGDALTVSGTNSFGAELIDYAL